MRHDYLVFIGRFEPLHNGHLAVLRHALVLADKVIVLIGSAARVSARWRSRRRGE
jgi:bifunctional NMN adenylyltransferase/nudix hydrolase